MKTEGSRLRAAVRVLIAAGGLGLVLTIGSLAIGTDVHADPAGDGYRGDARLLGYPQPFTYVLTSDTSAETMDRQVSCVVSQPLCRYPDMSSRVGMFSLISDWFVWSLIAAPFVLVAVLIRRVRRSGASVLP